MCALFPINSELDFLHLIVKFDLKIMKYIEFKLLEFTGKKTWK